MRISEITAFRHDTNYSGGEHSMSRGRISTSQPSLIARVRTDDGIEGWAETAPLGSDYLSSSFTGELAALEDDGRVMMSGMAAKAVLDVACWDILSKATQLPISTLTVPVPLEQPCRLLSDCAEVGRRTGLPIILDESIVTKGDLVAAYTAGITGVNMKLSRVGGFTKGRALRDAAVALGMMVIIDNTWGCALTTAQNLQLAASTPADHLRPVDLFVEWTSPAISEIPRMKTSGRVGHSSSPGNGLGPIDMKILAQPIFEIKG